MFTGIVEETGTIHQITTSESGIRMAVRSKLCAQDSKLGDSIAVNGCCLTVVKKSRKDRGESLLEFDLLKETWNRTNLQFATRGSLVNLERALRADARLGGHFVTGHIDGTGTIRTWEASGADWLLEIDASPELLRHIVFKGCIAVDGISLTVAAVAKRHFQIWIIPHTFEVTALRERIVGDEVNLETDLLAKYVEKIQSPSPAKGKRRSA